MSRFRLLELSFVGVSLATIAGTIATKRVELLAAPLLLEPAAAYVRQRERREANLQSQEERKKLSTTISELEVTNGELRNRLQNEDINQTLLQSQLAELEEEIFQLRMPPPPDLDIVEAEPTGELSVLRQQLQTERFTKEFLELRLKEAVEDRKAVFGHLDAERSEKRALEQKLSELQKQVKKQTYYYKLIKGRSDSRRLLLQALQDAQRTLVIVCPWITDTGLKDGVLEALEAALERGVIIDIGWGHLRDTKEIRLSLNRDNLLRSKASGLYSGITTLEATQSTYPRRFKLSVLGTHEKFLVVDRKYAFVGSHNFLTSGSTSPERELGIQTDNAELMDELVSLFPNRIAMNFI